MDVLRTHWGLSTRIYTGASLKSLIRINKIITIIIIIIINIIPYHKSVCKANENFLMSPRSSDS